MADEIIPQKRPCKYGHMAGRDKSGHCKICVKEIKARWVRNNPKKRKLSLEKYLMENPEKVRESARKFREKNREKCRALVGEWKKRNKDKIREAGRKYRAENADKCRIAQGRCYAKKPWFYVARVERRRAAKLKATPAWVDDNALLEVYKKASASKLEVDHIVPLRGKTVCGLHVPWNLQLLTKSENARKGNRLQ